MSFNKRRQELFEADRTGLVNIITELEQDYGLLLVRNNVLSAENEKANLRIAELESDVYAQALAKHHALDTVQAWETKYAELEAKYSRLHDAYELSEKDVGKYKATIKRVEGLPPDLTRSEQGGFGEPLIVEYVKRVNIRYAALAGDK